MWEVVLVMVLEFLFHHQQQWGRGVILVAVVLVQVPVLVPWGTLPTTGTGRFTMMSVTTTTTTKTTTLRQQQLE